MPFVPLALPPALGDPSMEFVNSYPKDRRYPWSKDWAKIALCLADCLSLPRAAGDSPQRLVLGQSQTARPGWKALRPICHFADRATGPMSQSPTLDLCLKLIWAKFGLLLRQGVPAEGCFEVRWMYLTDVILPTDHRKTSRTQSE